MTASVAKLCYVSKQYFAWHESHTHSVGKNSINAVFAANLKRRMDAAGFSQLSLGKRAGVSQRSVGNYLNPKDREASAKGKQPSAKLTEMAMIADALDVEPWEMLIPAADNRDASVEKSLLELSALFRGMPPTAQTALLEQARIVHKATRVQEISSGELAAKTGTHD